MTAEMCHLLAFGEKQDLHLHTCFNFLLLKYDRTVIQSLPGPWTSILLHNNLLLCSKMEEERRWIFVRRYYIIGIHRRQGCSQELVWTDSKLRGLIDQLFILSTESDEMERPSSSERNSNVE